MNAAILRQLAELSSACEDEIKAITRIVDELPINDQSCQLIKERASHLKEAGSEFTTTLHTIAAKQGKKVHSDGK